MKVFKLYLKLALHYWQDIMIYTILSFVIFMVMSIYNGSVEKSYSPTTISISIVDNDHSELSGVLCDFIHDKFEVEEYIDEKDIEDAFFYQVIPLSIEIPKGFEQDFINGTIQVDTKSKNGSVSSQVGKKRINDYLNMMYKTSKLYPNLSYKEINKLVMYINDDSDEIEISMSAKNEEKISLLSRQFSFLSYTIISVLMISIGLCMVSLRSRETHLRLMSSPLNSSRITLESMAAATVVSLGLLLVYYVGIGILNGGVMFSKEGIILMINGIFFMLAILAFSIMISMLISGKKEKGDANERLTMICNVIGLACSFIGGAFVPQAFIGESVLKFASFTPTYWFVKTNELITSQNYSFNDILSNMSVLVLFAVAFSLMSIIMNRIKMSRQSIS